MTKKEKIYQKCNGRCGYCGEILQPNWQVDHMDSQFTLSRLYSERDVHDIDNLMPSCKECNHYKRSLSVSNCSPEEKTWKEYMMTFHIRLGKLPKNTTVERTKKRIRYMWTIANKYDIMPHRPFSGVFYYETIKENGKDIQYNKPDVSETSNRHHEEERRTDKEQVPRNNRRRTNREKQ